MELPCLFTRQQTLKLGYYYRLRVKNSNHLHTELSLCYLKHTKFYNENKASFIQISGPGGRGVLHLSRFLLPGCGHMALFQESSVVSLKSLPWPKYTKYGTIFPKKVMFYNFFSFSNMFFIRLFLANNWKESRGSPCLFPHKLSWKVDMVLTSQSGYRICVVGTGRRYKIAPIVFEVCSRDQACFRFFLWARYRQHRKSTTYTKEWGKSRFDEILELWTFILDYFVALAFCVAVS